LANAFDENPFHVKLVAIARAFHFEKRRKQGRGYERQRQYRNCPDSGVRNQQPSASEENDGETQELIKDGFEV
jgi:hypothetical protein